MVLTEMIYFFWIFLLWLCFQCFQMCVRIWSKSVITVSYVCKQNLESTPFWGKVHNFGHWSTQTGNLGSDIYMSCFCCFFCLFVFCLVGWFLLFFLFFFVFFRIQSVKLPETIGYSATDSSINWEPKNTGHLPQLTGIPL